MFAKIVPTREFKIFLKVYVDQSKFNELFAAKFEFNPPIPKNPPNYFEEKNVTLGLLYSVASPPPPHTRPYGQLLFPCLK